MRESLGAVLAIIAGGALLFGMMHIFAGVLLGSLIVLALMCTVERIPGFWPFACTSIGMIVVLIGTGWLTHAVFGTTSIVGMTAFAWSILAKIWIIDAERQSRLAY